MSEMEMANKQSPVFPSIGGKETNMRIQATQTGADA